MKNLAAFLCLVVIPLSSYSQSVVQAAEVRLQPQIGRDAKGYTWCGIRAIVLDDRKDSVDSYDFAISLKHGSTMALTMAGKAKYTQLPNGKLSSKPVLPAPVNFWIVRDTEAKPLMAAKVMPDNDTSFVIGAVDMADAWKTTMDIISGKRMQFAVRFKDQSSDTVVSFSKKLSEEETFPLISCFDGFFKRMKEEATGKTDILTGIDKD